MTDPCPLWRPAWSRWLLGLYVAAVLAFLILPILIVLPMSFSDSRFLTFPPPGWSLRWYEEFFASRSWMQAARTSLGVALLATLLATPLGIAAAYALHNTSSRLLRGLRFVFLLPLMVPIIIVAVGVFFVYAKVGLLASIPGLVLADTMLGLPYVMTAVAAGLQGFDQTQELVARSLGMNRLRAFLSVTLPQIRPSVVSGAIFVFIAALDETIVALFISGGANQTLTKKMFTVLRDEIDPTIAAISTLLTAASFALILLLALSRRRPRG
ncbi:putative spermidine/putrescine transport system permease protein [Tistlia consotensis]|uniref:Putative spermidine/putrescine transport system permease protein n=1 Tax=Tistlia consotensis USBA 355 TaxID=560819 RepID=A0A1Y6BS53_9PROT|nr:ABC transporter permease [Tistlia consotensis]SMF25271.1 putative spermidine/putrescine transport system permease protein [Tistlia consotensis USBA 355]SNR59648.1 putative spermidine/putrescine transport system permease protein [Tistlia consotensis]